MPSEFVVYRKCVIGEPRTLDGQLMIDRKLAGESIRMKPVKVTIGMEIPSILPGVEFTEGEIVHRKRHASGIVTITHRISGGTTNVSFAIGRYRIDEIERRLDDAARSLLREAAIEGRVEPPIGIHIFILSVSNHIVTMRIDNDFLQFDFTQSNIAEALGFEVMNFRAGRYLAPHRNRLHACPEVLDCVISPITVPVGEVRYRLERRCRIERRVVEERVAAQAVEAGQVERGIPFPILAREPFDVSIETIFPSIDIVLDRNLIGFQISFNRISSYIIADTLFDRRYESLILPDGGFVEVVLQIDS